MLYIIYVIICYILYTYYIYMYLFTYTSYSRTCRITILNLRESGKRNLWRGKCVPH